MPRSEDGRRLTGEMAGLGILLAGAAAVTAWGYALAPPAHPVRILAQGRHGQWVLIRRTAVEQNFRVPAAHPQHLQGNTSLALAGYLGWEANGSARSQGSVAVRDGQLVVGLRRAFRDFRGYFLTATHALPPTCTFEAWAADPPPVAKGTGELVFAVQTASTIRTGLINYVWVSQVVRPRGRYWSAGYAEGRIRRARQWTLARAPVSRFPPPADGINRLAVATDGHHRLTVWINGQRFLAARGLNMAIAPPFEPYLEMQAKGTAYRVFYTRYAAVRGRRVELSGLPAGTRVEAGSRIEVVQRGRLQLARPPQAGPLTVTVTVPGGSPHHLRLWPGDRVQFRPAAGRPHRQAAAGGLATVDLARDGSGPVDLMMNSSPIPGRPAALRPERMSI